LSHPGRGTLDHRRFHLRPWVGGAEAAQLGEDVVEGLAVDELHDVVMSAGLLAHGEDRHDVAVVQPRRRPRLALEALDVAGVAQGPGRQHLQRHAPAQRLLLGLVDHAHAAPAYLPYDSVLAQPLWRPCWAGRRGANHGWCGSDLFEKQQGGEQLADLLGQLGVAFRVLRQRRPFAAAMALEEVVGELA
jgi:hypothetical protein